MKKNNKGFSLIELIIVIAIMAILVAIIAPNLTKYLAKSKRNTDKKNADEIAAQIQTAINDYESQENASPIGNGTVTFAGTTPESATWSASTGSTGGAITSPAGDSFATIINSAVTSSTKSKEKNTNAKADIVYNSASGVYTITVTVGTQSVKK